MRSLLGLLLLSALVQIQAVSRDRLKSNAADKLLFSKRPEKAKKGVLERPESPDLETPSSETDDFFDWDDFFGEIPHPSSRNVTQMFKQIWSRVLGSSETSDEDETPQERSFLGGFLNMMRPWWKGENVCSREEEYEEEQQEESFFSSLQTSCQDVGSAYKCTMKLGQDGKMKVRTLIYECCHGWSRRPGAKGCPERVELKDLFQTLRDLNLTKFVETAESVGLDSKYSEGNFTLFVPTNEALSSITESNELSVVVAGTPDKMQYIREILLAHTAPGWQYSYVWEDEMTLATDLQGANVRINYFPFPRSLVTANCARVTLTDQQTTSGLVHAVDRVLVPATRSLWQMISEDPRFSIFSSLVDDELKAELSRADAHYTILTFTDEAFDRLAAPMKSKILNKEGCMQNFVKELILPHTICSAAVQDQTRVRNLAGHLIDAERAIDEAANQVSFHNVAVSVADQMATNGVVHILDGVVLLDHLMDTLSVSERLGGERWTELLESNKLDEELETKEALTIFLPLQKALENMPSDAETVKNHIVENLVEIGANEEMIVKTAAGRELVIKAQRNPFAFTFGRRPGLVAGTIGCARIVQAGLQACNGQVHLIDRPLKVPTQTIMELLRDDDNLSEFVTMIEIAEMEDDLEDFDGTVLAPSNEAIEESISSEKKAELINNKEKLREFLKRHFLTESVCCHSFGSRFWFQQRRHQTLGGGAIGSIKRGPKRYVGGSLVDRCDLEASNGLVHVLAKPLLPRRRSTSVFDFFRSRRNPWGSTDPFNIDFDF